MRAGTYLAAGFLGLALSLAGGAAPVRAQSGSIVRLMEGERTSRINLVVDRALVMESDIPFKEVSVANPDIADIATLSERTVYLLGKKPGRTNVTLLGPNGQLIANVEVAVRPDIAEFKERLKEILPKERIDVRTANDGIVLSGQVSSARKAQLALDLAERYAPEKVTNLMTVGGSQQVMLKVRFAEMQRSVAKGLTSSLVVNGKNATGGGLGAATGSMSSNANIQRLTGQTTTPLSSATERFGTLVFGLGAGATGVALMLEALEQKGLVRTLAEPNLVAISGKKAEFLAGGEYPIPINKNGDTAIEYKPFGVNLTFVPVVIDDDMISLSIIASVSEIDPTVQVTANGFTVNAFKTRSARTTIELRDGQSFAIAGLLQDDFKDSIQQLPWLADVPVLGALFRSTSFQRRQTELVVIVTAYLVHPAPGNALALPTDRVRIPTEAELFLFGSPAARSGRKVAKSSSGAVPARKEPPSGAFGYVME